MSRLNAPAVDVIPITPSDSAFILDHAGNKVTTRAVRASGAGNIAGYTSRGGLRTVAILAGETRAIQFYRIMSTNTTATGIEGMI